MALHGKHSACSLTRIDLCKSHKGIQALTGQSQTPNCRELFNSDPRNKKGHPGVCLPHQEGVRSLMMTTSIADACSILVMHITACPGSIPISVWQCSATAACSYETKLT